MVGPKVRRVQFGKIHGGPKSSSGGVWETFYSVPKVRWVVWAGWLIWLARLAGRPAGWLLAGLAGWLAGWLTGWLVGWLVWLAGWLAGCFQHFRL